MRIITSPFIAMVFHSRSRSRMRAMEKCAPMRRSMPRASTRASSTADSSAISAASPTPSEVMPSSSTKKAESAMLVRFRNSCTMKASFALRLADEPAHDAVVGERRGRRPDAVVEIGLAMGADLGRAADQVEGRVADQRTEQDERDAGDAGNHQRTRRERRRARPSPRHPVAWAERPPVDSRRKPKPQKMKEKISAPTAMAPM